MQANEKKNVPESDVWQQLLNPVNPMKEQPLPDAEAVTMVSPLAGDPWSALLQAQGVQVVDLQQTRLHEVHATLNEKDVEQALYFMQEQGKNEE